MAVFYGQQMTKLRVDPVTVPDPGFVDGTVRCFVEEITLATQTTADTIEIARLPKGAVPLYGVVETDTSLGTTLLGIGIAGSVAKYRTATAFTALNTPTLFGVGAGIGVALADEEIVFITIGSASFPSSGTLRVMFFYAFN